MVNAVAQYRRALEKKLRCRKEVKNRLLVGFDKTLNTYQEEYIAPSMDDLITAFGPPEEMAKILMAEVAPQELAEYSKNALIQKILAVFFAVFLALFTFYILFVKEVGLTTSDRSTVTDRNTEPTTSFTKEENIP